MGLFEDSTREGECADIEPLDQFTSKGVIKL